MFKTKTKKALSRIMLLCMLLASVFCIIISFKPQKVYASYISGWNEGDVINWYASNGNYARSREGGIVWGECYSSNGSAIGFSTVGLRIFVDAITIDGVRTGYSDTYIDVLRPNDSITVIQYDAPNVEVKYGYSGGNVYVAYCISEENLLRLIKAKYPSLPYYADADIDIHIDSIMGYRVNGDLYEGTYYLRDNNDGTISYDGILHFSAQSMHDMYLDKTGLDVDFSESYGINVRVHNEGVISKIWFDPNGGSNTGDLFGVNYYEVKFGADYNSRSNVSNAIPVRTGYKFTGWYTQRDGGDLVYERDGSVALNYSYWKYENKTWKWQQYTDVTLYAHWELAEADYTVNCYFADENGSYRTLPDKSVSKRGIIGNTAAVTPSEYLSGSESGKYEIDASKSTPGYRTEITADGQAEINLYFDRTKYSVTLTKGDNIESVTGAAKEVRWGAEVTINAVTESIVGYNISFVNWTEGSSAVSKDNPYTFKMPQRDVSYRANGIKTPRTDIVYRVNHYTQNLDGTWKKYGSTEIYNNGTADSSVKTADYKKDIQGFTYLKGMTDGKEATEAIIKPDGSLVIELYYTRNSYTLTVNPNGSTWTDGGVAYTKPRTYTLKYQETKTIADPVRTGYSFKKWVMTPSGKGSSISGKVFTMGYADTTLTVTMDKGSSSESWDVNTYTVTYDRNTPAGTISTEGGQTPDSLHTYDVTGSLSANGFTLSGYTFNGWKLDNKGNTYGNSENKGAVEVLNLTSEDGAVLTMYAQWKANTDTSYKVNHWIQKLYSDGTQAGGYLDGTVKSDAGKKNTDNYYLALTEQFTGTTDSFVTPDTATVGNKKLESEDFTIAGFTAPSKVTVQISGDGTTVVDYYYTRNWYDVGGNEVPGDNNPDDNPDNTPDDTPSVPGNPDRTEPEAGNGVDHITGGGTYQYQEKVTVSAILKPGYHWDPDDEEFPSGWSGTENLPDADAYTKQTMTFTMPAANVVLKSDATNNRYTVQWNKNTPSNATHTVEGEMSDVVYVYDRHKNASDNSYSLTGWDYVEWNTKPDGSGDVISNSADVFNLTTEDGAVVQLYAQWRAHTYTLKLSVNKPTDPILASNEISGEIADIELTYDTYTTLPDAFTSISLEGWTFAGWYESAEYDESHKDNADAHHDRITVSFGSHNDVLNTLTGSLIRNQGRVMNFTTEQDAVITIYAQWTNNDYKIVFDDNGGYWGPGEMALNYDVASTLPSAPTRYGFKFLGWQDAVRNIYNPGEQVLNLTPEQGSQVIFTAQWEQRHFKLIKIASSMYNGTLINRTEGDDAWYDTVGKLNVKELISYPGVKCIQQWKIDENGNIMRIV